MYNQDVLNIVDIQNVADPAGVSITQQLANLNSMVDFANKQVNADRLAAFTPQGAINVVSPLNFDSNSSQTTLSNVTGAGYELRVYGTVFASNYNSLCPLVFTAGGKESMWVTEEGHVGVGVSTPKTHLHVGGNVLIDGNAEIRGTTVFTDAVVFNDDVTFNGNDVTFNCDVHINGRLFINGSRCNY